jgi:hypothetical protein
MSVMLRPSVCIACGKKLYTNLANAKCRNCTLGKQASTSVVRKAPIIPPWVHLISYFKSPDDLGIGDTVARYAAMLGGEAFKAWSKKLGMPCGCTQRQREWNARYPYTSPHDQPQS